MSQFQKYNSVYYHTCGSCKYKLYILDTGALIKYITFDVNNTYLSMDILYKYVIQFEFIFTIQNSS